jgi:hypothetical protein
MTEEEIQRNVRDFFNKYKIYRFCLNKCLPQYIHDEYDKICWPLKSVHKDTFHTNEFTDYVLVLDV